jgi:hypothetical protein
MKINTQNHETSANTVFCIYTYIVTRYSRSFNHSHIIFSFHFRKNVRATWTYFHNPKFQTAVDLQEVANQKAEDR